MQYQHSAVLVKTPAREKCAVRRAVKGIRRHAHESTIEKSIHTYINIYRELPLNTTYRCSLASLAR